MTEEAGAARLVLGTMYYGTRIHPRDAFDLMDRFVAAGGRWLDTADCYTFWADTAGRGGASESVIGEWLRRRPGVRDAVRIATKVGQNPTEAHRWPETAEGLSASAILSALEGSLERMGVESVDLLWAHAEDRRVPLEETVAAFGEVVSRGVAARVGAANHPARRVERARTIASSLGVEPWSAVQLRYSLVEPRPGAALPDAGHRLLTPDDLDHAVAEALDVWAYTPLLNGGYTRTDRPFPEAYDHPGTARRLRVLEEVANETGATRNQVVLAWLLRQGISPLVGVSTMAQLDEAIAATDLTLDAEHLRRFADAR